MRRVDVPNKKVLETACASISIELHLEWRIRVVFGGDGEAVENINTSMDAKNDQS